MPPQAYVDESKRGAYIAAAVGNDQGAGTDASPIDADISPWSMGRVVVGPSPDEVELRNVPNPGAADPQGA